MSPGRALRQLAALARLPGPVRRHYARALWRARRRGDQLSLDIAARPLELNPILRAAGGARTVAEIGTGTAWTAIALTLADPARRVLTVDVQEREGRAAYLELMPTAARERLTLATRPGEAGPAAGEGPFEFLFIDSSHELDETMRTFELWSAAVPSGGAVAFHDHRNPNYPDVARAVERLNLEGEESHLLFVWRKP
jgi:predicted O-methyltransferase YrrM